MSTVSGMALRLTPSRRCLRAFIASTPVLSTAVAAGRLRQQAEDLHNRSPDRTNPFSIHNPVVRGNPSTLGAAGQYHYRGDTAPLAWTCSNTPHYFFVTTIILLLLFSAHTFQVAL